MPRITLGRNSRLAALLAATVLGLAVATGAAADTPPGRGPNGGPAPTPTPPGGDCSVLRVQLNGNQPATHTCLAPAPSPSAPGTGSPAPALVHEGGCWAGDLMLYSDTNYGGKRLCLTGYGTTNLRDYSFSWYGSWEDRVSSFRNGHSKVVFYEHANAGGAKLYYLDYQERAVMRDGWNDRISSICIPSWSSSWYPCR